MYRARFGPIHLALLVTALGCATRTQLPPRVDLGEWDLIGIVQFSGGDDAELAGLATGQFVQMLQAAQPGARILELGPEQQVLSELGHEKLDFEAMRAMRKRYDVDAVITGGLELSSVEPDLRFGDSLRSVRAAANVNGQLATKLLETRSGATVWSRTTQATANVARLGVPSDGETPSFQIGRPGDAYAELVPQLVANLRHDFYPTWRKR